MGEFSKVFRSLRKQSGMTQSVLSGELGISRSAVGMYESGAREPDFETLERIADFFNVNMDYLIGRSRDAYFNKEGAKEPSYESIQSLIARNGKALSVEQKQEIIKALLSDQ